MRIILAVAALLMVPLASAGSTPVVGFLDDGETGPVGEGTITHEYPDSNESMVRAILADVGQGPTTIFTATNHSGTHLKGPLFAGLWADELAGQDGMLVVAILVDGEVVSTAEVDVAFDPESLPDPESLIPPDPTDPEGAVFHVVGQAMPYIFQAPLVMDMGYVDVEIPNGSDLSIALSIQTPGDVPTGLMTTMKYDGILTPSFVYLPYWTADPEATPPQLPPPRSEPNDPGASDPDPPTDDNDDEGSEGKDSPGIGLVLVGGLLAVAAIAARRRT